MNTCSGGFRFEGLNYFQEPQRSRLESGSHHFSGKKIQLGQKLYGIAVYLKPISGLTVLESLTCMRCGQPALEGDPAVHLPNIVSTLCTQVQLLERTEQPIHSEAAMAWANVRAQTEPPTPAALAASFLATLASAQLPATALMGGHKASPEFEPPPTYASARSSLLPQDSLSRRHKRPHFIDVADHWHRGSRALPPPPPPFSYGDAHGTISYSPGRGDYSRDQSRVEEWMMIRDRDIADRDTVMADRGKPWMPPTMFRATSSTHPPAPAAWPDEREGDGERERERERERGRGQGSERRHEAPWPERPLHGAPWPDRRHSRSRSRSPSRAQHNELFRQRSHRSNSPDCGREGARRDHSRDVSHSRDRGEEAAYRQRHADRSQVG